jgi:hypothetical protein
VEDEVMDLIDTNENIFGVMDVNEELPPTWRWTSSTPRPRGLARGRTRRRQPE